MAKRGKRAKPLRRAGRFQSVDDLPVNIRQLNAGKLLATEAAKAKQARTRGRGNIRCYVDRAGKLVEMEIGGTAPLGVEVFDSKLEANVWIELCRLFGAVNIKRQASFRLMGGRKIVPDFLILRDGLRPLFVDAKGRMEKDWAVKKSAFEGEYGYEIHLIHRVAECAGLIALASR